MSRMTTLRSGLSLAALLVSLSAHSATTITIVNADGANEGFNDATPVAPVGGNNGTTLGQQRLIVFQYAADHWASRINSDVEIRVEAKLDPLSCSATSAVVGSAGTTTVHRDFAGAPRTTTWYPQALANSLAGADLSPTNPDIGTTFNSAIDYNDNCLRSTNWYLGLDGNNSGDIDMVDVVMHEIGHGLGFASYVDETTGAVFFNYMDVYSVHLEDHSAGRTWPQMTNNQRKASAIDSGDLHFVGPNIVASAGHTPMYAPSTVRPGSSVSHFDTSLTPNELMEPFVASLPIHDMGLAYELMLDIGWQPAGQPGNTAPGVTISSPAPAAEYTEGDTVALAATASDNEDGDLSGSIAWSSDKDGGIGTGASTSTSTLSLGDHTLTASVTDSNGVGGSDQVSVSIVSAIASAPNSPSTVLVEDLANGTARVTWQDNSNNESQFEIVRESPHKRHTDRWVGTTQVSTVASDITSYDDASGAGTFRYCITASNAAGSSSAACSQAEDITAGGGGSGGGDSGGGSFCDSRPTHQRCN